MPVNRLEDVYGSDKLALQKERYADLAKAFEEYYGEKPTRFFSAPGRTEICGNHTDHNGGHVLAASVSLDVIAAAVPTYDNIIQIKSEGYRKNKIDLSKLLPFNNERGHSSALIRGVAAGIAKNGGKIGGFKAYTSSNVLKGSGLSSSAAFEVVVAEILNGLYNSGRIDAVTVAKISQYAENKYFGKPSGIMDQLASSVGGFICMDLENMNEPVISKVNFDFSKSGHNLCIVDTKGNHADLTPEYAAIPAEMKHVANYFGKQYLREVTKADIIDNYTDLRKSYGDRAVLRALHFMDDDRRVLLECEALAGGRFNEFLKLINESGDSSYKYLQNIFASSEPKEQGLSSALYVAREILGNSGACRVHGGGFAGTVQAFVPNEKLAEFKLGMEKLFGEGSCHVLDIRPVGGTEITLE